MQETKKLIKDLVKVELTKSQIAALESFIGDRGISIEVTTKPLLLNSVNGFSMQANQVNVW
jgi:hypothetical protein